VAADSDVDTVEFPLPIPSPEPRRVSARAEVDIAGASHVGKVRTKNEDVYLIVRRTRQLQVVQSNLTLEPPQDTYEEVGYGLVVADGMGGMSAGDVAGKLAVTTLLNLTLNTPDWVMLGGEPEGERILQRITQRYRQIHDALRGESWGKPELWGMGTTLTLAANLGNELFLGHVGDSRAYLYGGGKLRRLTCDHTVVQELLDTGVIRPDQAATYRRRNVLTSALGGTGELNRIDVDRTVLADGDQLLLCSDGLTNMVEEEAITAILQQAGTAAEACQSLIDLALTNGGKDNVTVALARYRFPEDASTPS